ncbi:hypothetical protein BGZ65_009802, partial [Modicella reniformis]
AIHRHTQLVRTFKDGCCIEQEKKELLDLKFLNLVSLDLRTILLGEDMKEWVLGHSSLTYLRLSGYKLNAVFWSTLLGFRRLKGLRVQFLDLRKDADGFWQLCTHLERLEIIRPAPLPQGNLLSMEFPSIKELRFDLTDWDHVRILEFMQRCPNLTSFEFVGGEECARFASPFSDLVTARTWPHLHSVSIVWNDIAEDSILRIIGGMQRINAAFDICYSPNFFGSNAMELLRPHFSNIRALHLRPAFCTTSQIAQEILSSCPLLERLAAPPIEASVIAEGNPWVCTRLQELKLMFVYDNSTLSRLQPLVFDRLARLVQLEEWSPTDRQIYPSDRMLDLTLENGLGKLSTLRSLRSIDFHYASQVMEQQEIDWIFEHWTDLESVRGNLSTLGDAINDLLSKQLREHGIRYRVGCDPE